MSYSLSFNGVDLADYELKLLKPTIPFSQQTSAIQLRDKAIASDVERVKELGVIIKYDVNIDKQLFEKLQNENSYIYIAAGAQNSAKLKIEGISSAGVVDPLKLLEDVKLGNIADYGKRIAIIGGGNTAMVVQSVRRKHC